MINMKSSIYKSSPFYSTKFIKASEEFAISNKVRYTKKFVLLVPLGENIEEI